MFFHIKELQYEAKPERPDPIFAKKLQEILGGQFGEISVAIQYLFQGWGTRKHDKYRDLLWGSKPVLSPAPPALHNTPPSVK